MSVYDFIPLKEAPLRLRLLSYFTKLMKYDQSFMFHWFPSDCGYYRNASLLPFVLNNVNFLKTRQKIQNKAFKFSRTHVSLAADEVSRKLIGPFSSKLKMEVMERTAALTVAARYTAMLPPSSRR